MATTTGATSGSQPADITGITNMIGTLIITATTIQLVSGSINMGTVDGTPFGEAGNDLNLTANITLFADSTVVPTPEPSTALLMGLGLAGLTAAGRQRRRGDR